MTPLYIHGVGHFHPPNTITNQFLEDLDIGTTAAWIEERLGIRERRTVLDLDYIRRTRNLDTRAAIEASAYSNTDTSEAAARMALERAGIAPADLGLILSGSCCPVHTSPAEATILAHRLGISPIAFDVNSACNGSLIHTSVAQAWLAANDCDFALLIQAEQITRSVDYSERTGAALMGDGTTALVVSTRHPSPLMIGDVKITSEFELWDAAYVPAGKHFRQVTSNVRDFALKHLAGGIPPVHDSYVIFHQANLRLLEAAARQLGIAPGYHLYDVDMFGNRAAAGAISVLSKNWEMLLAQPGDIAISTLGAGLTHVSGMFRRTSSSQTGGSAVHQPEHQLV